MKSTPMLYNTEMVRALLSGAKTQTRRPVKFPACPCGCGTPSEFDGYAPNGDVLCSRCDQPTGSTVLRNPFGVPGDRLWVRETWAVPEGSTSPGDVAYRADLRPEDEAEERRVRRLVKRVDNPWRPSIHMPRWAARIFLEIIDVRIQRVQEITEEDARAEGIDNGPELGPRLYPSPRAARSSLGYRNRFAEVWEDIYGTWDANAWVRALTFRRIEAV